MLTIYGIKNCDTVKKARKWLEAEGIEHVFHDFRADGLERGVLEAWLKQVDRDVLINRRGTTWRKLDDAQKEISTDAEAVALLLEHEAIIKRPVFDKDGTIFVGFGDGQRNAILAP